MSRQSTSAIGALHPVLFFLFIYGISLFLALFVCRTVYYSIHDEVSISSNQAMNTDLSYSGSESNATALK